EDLAVADLPGLGRVGDHLDHLVDLIVVDGDVDPDLGQEVHRIFGAAIDLLVALLAAVAFDLGDGHALDAGGRERVAHVVELEWFDDSDDQFHGIVPRYAAPIEPRVSRRSNPAGPCEWRIALRYRRWNQNLSRFVGASLDQLVSRCAYCGSDADLNAAFACRAPLPHQPFLDHRSDQGTVAREDEAAGEAAGTYHVGA